MFTADLEVAGRVRIPGMTRKVRPAARGSDFWQYPWSSRTDQGLNGMVYPDGLAACASTRYRQDRNGRASSGNEVTRGHGPSTLLLGVGSGSTPERVREQTTQSS